MDVIGLDHRARQIPDRVDGPAIVQLPHHIVDFILLHEEFESGGERLSCKTPADIDSAVRAVIDAVVGDPHFGHLLREHARRVMINLAKIMNVVQRNIDSRQRRGRRPDAAGAEVVQAVPDDLRFGIGDVESVTARASNRVADETKPLAA